MQKGLPVVSAACAAALSLAAAGVQAAAPAANRYVDVQEGYSITLPSQWYVIPRTTALIKQAVSTLKREKNSSLAGAYNSILVSPQSLQELTLYRFQAFLWPPLDSPIPTEVDLKIVSGKYTTATLAADAQGFAESLSGVKVGGITRLTLGAGRSEFFEGTVANGGGVTTGLEFYFFAHKNRLYILSFELGDSFLHQARIAAVLRSIAADFSFSV